MAEKIISPGVFTSEIDQTFLPSAIADIGAVVIGPTVKGPALVPTVVSSYSEYQARFGDAFVSGSNYYQYLTSHTAKEYLKNADKLTVVRVLAGGYSGASATISSSINPAVVGGGVKATGSFTIAAGEYGEGSPESMSIGGVNFIYTGSGASYTNSSTNIYVVSSSATPTLLAGQFRDVINNSSSLHSLSITASSAAALVGLSSSKAGRMHGLDGPSLFGGSTISGTLDLDGDGTAFTSQTQLQGGEEYNSAVFLEPLKLHTLADGDILNSVGPIGTNSILVSGSRNNLRFEIGSVNTSKGTFTLLVRQGNDSNKRKQILETWNNVSLDPNSNNYISKMVGDSYLSIQGSGTADPYLKSNGSYPNKSKYVRVEPLKFTDDYLDENGAVRTPAYSASLPTVGSGSSGGSFSGGSDGDVQHGKNFNENITLANTQGLNLTTGQSGETSYLDALSLLNNQDEYDFNLLMLPGVLDDTHNSVISKAIDVCEDRGDCFVLIDPVGHGSSISAAKTEAETRDSNYAAVYWPWVQISDNQLGKSVWVPPSVVVSGMYAFNDKVSHPWFAPAGLGRGTLDTVIQAERKLTHSNRDTLYDSNVNPIATFPVQGVTVWGQKTLQKKASALDRVNVRRLLIKLKKFIASSSRFLVFEQNNASTRRRFMNIVNPFLEQVQSNSGLTAFRVVMDETNNTPDVVDRNVLYGQIFVQPTRTAEFIVLDFTVQPTGATFPE
jgi:hypothetical protein